MALAPFGVIGGGKLRTDAEEEKRAASGENGRTLLGGDWRRTENEKKMSHALEKVASEVGVNSITSGTLNYIPSFTSLVKFESLVAIAYVMHKAPYVFPLVGGRKVEHLLDNIEALKISLSDEQMLHLESVVPFDIGFPNRIFVSQKFSRCFFLLNEIILQFQGDGTKYGIPWTANANVEQRPRLQPIRPQGNK